MSEKALKKAAAPKEAVASVCGALEEATFFLIRCSLQLNGKISVECAELRVVASVCLLYQFSFRLRRRLKVWHSYQFALFTNIEGVFW